MLKESESPIKLDETFREDYEQGVVNGEYCVSYHGQCSVCKLTHTFKHSQRLSW